MTLHDFALLLIGFVAGGFTMIAMALLTMGRKPTPKQRAVEARQSHLRG